MGFNFGCMLVSWFMFCELIGCIFKISSILLLIVAYSFIKIKFIQGMPPPPLKFRFPYLSCKFLKFLRSLLLLFLSSLVRELPGQPFFFFSLPLDRLLRLPLLPLLLLDLVYLLHPLLLLTLLLLPLLVVGNVLVALDILDNLVNILLGDYLRGGVKRGGSRYRCGGNLTNKINLKGL